MAKKPEEHAASKNDQSENFESALRNSRRNMEGEKADASKKARDKAKDSCFYAACGAVGFVFDIAVLGGLGTCLALGSSVMWATYKTDERNARKEVERIDGKLMEIEELNTLKPRLPAPAVKQEFNDNSEVADLQKKLADVQKELEEVKNGNRMPDKGLDKTKFSPPQL